MGALAGVGARDRRVNVGSEKELMEVRKIEECNCGRMGEHIAFRRMWWLSLWMHLRMWRSGC